MPSYRLLRSNKESGPYSLNDLVTLGLKPYDLVWVDGRSAAWRYPSEVAELKEFAPVVEEQPYDRFYKKSSETEAVAKESTAASLQEIPQRNPVKEPVVFSQPEIIQPKIPVKENIIKEEPVQQDSFVMRKPVTEIPNPSYQQYKPQPRKQVFVSMPENNGFNSYQQDAHQNYPQEEYQQYLPKPKPVQEKQIPVEKPYVAPKEKSYSPIDIHEPDETKLETKYTQSLDDIKEMYINTLVQRKTRNRRKEIFRKYVKPALVPLFLVISGIAIGYVITYKKSSSSVLQGVSKVVPQQVTPATPEQKDEEVSDNKMTDNKILPPERNQSLVIDNHKNKAFLNQREQSLAQSQKQNKSIQAVPKAIVPERKERETFVPDNEVATYQKKDVQVDPATGERTRAVRDNDEIVAKENTPRNNAERYNKKNDQEPNFIEENEPKSIRDFVSVKNNNYIRGAFGGIRGLELTVYNRSAFLLDEVSIELQIMKPSEEPLRTDIITVKNISPNGSVTVRVPDSQRGIRADYRITNVESRQWQKSTAGL